MIPVVYYIKAAFIWRPPKCLVHKLSVIQVSVRWFKNRLKQIQFSTSR